MQGAMILMYTDTEIIEYYKNHSNTQTSKQFNISDYYLTKILKQNNIQKHTPKESAQFYENGAKVKFNKQYDEFISKVNLEELYNFYKTNGKNDTLTKYNISSGILKRVLEEKNLKPLTAREVIDINLVKKYGSIEAGRHAVSQKMIDNTDWETRNKHLKETCQKRFGGDSPFSSSEVQKKKDQTILNRYQVSNISKLPEVLDKIKDTKITKYGGHGFDSPEINAKYQKTLWDHYKVEYGCLTPNCINASHGNNSKPNKYFADKLTALNIPYQTEFILDTKRYDFKIDNILIEIDPSATHNINWSPFGNQKTKVDKNYHLEKTLIAEKYGYSCIHIFDWDEMDKILFRLTNKEFIGARKCVIKNVSDLEAKEYLTKYHLQGYIKANIQIGLYYNNELVSLMTFGKPRYNKKYEFELLRYCFSKNIIGGAEKLFKYFINTYAPKSIISYCDKSKFKGDVYTKLGFTLLRKNITPSKHWYHLNSKRHITDNLLRQRGYDQLFNTNYGKGTNNEELMRNSGFVEIYDCGQATYVYNIQK